MTEEKNPIVEKSVAYTKAVRQDGFVISLTAKAETIFDAYEDLAHTIDVNELEPWVESRNLVGTEPYQAPTSMVDEALSLGAEQVNFLGRKKFPPKPSETQIGDAYEVVANLYSFDEEGIRFYRNDDGTISKYPVAKINFAGKGRDIFEQVFGDWQPEVGSKIPMPESVLYIQCGPNVTPAPHNNPYHNVRGVTRV